MKWRIVEARVVGPHSLDLAVKDGTRKQVDLLPLLEGPVFEPLGEPEYFARVVLDPVAGTVVGPNGAAIAPETLYELPEKTRRHVARRSPNHTLQRPGERARWAAHATWSAIDRPNILCPRGHEGFP